MRKMEPNPKKKKNRNPEREEKERGRLSYLLRMQDVRSVSKRRALVVRIEDMGISAELSISSGVSKAFIYLHIFFCK